MNRHIFRITGDDPHTGAERTFFVGAENDAEARRFATRRGVMIVKIDEVSEGDVPPGIPILPAHRTARPERPEWAPWIDFAFLPPSGYLGAGLAGVVLGVLIQSWSMIRATDRARDAVIGMGAPDVSGVMRGHLFWNTIAITIGVAGLTLLILGCIRFAAYQRNSDI